MADVLFKLDPTGLEQVKVKLNRELFNQKWLLPSRLLGKFYTVAVDATGVMSFDYPHCEHCMTKTSKKGKTTWFHYVLEAKLVTSQGHCISLGSEWIENPTGRFDKQDCELKAFARLSERLRHDYPNLPICILADGLYANNTVFDICGKNNWKYLIVLQDKQLRCVHDEVDLIRLGEAKRKNYFVKDGYRTECHYRFHTDIEYKKHHIHWLSCVETRKKDIRQGVACAKEVKTSTFEYVTNIRPEADTIIRLCFHGRLRWKIENEGFNTQKCSG